MFNLSVVRKIFIKMYKDKMTVRRIKTTVGDDYTSDPDYDDTPILIDVPCKVSRMVPDQTKPIIDALNPNKIAFRIFFDIENDIKKGDLISFSIMLNNKAVKEFEAVAGEPMIYETHCEMEVMIDGDA